MDCLNDEVKAIVAAGYVEHIRDVVLSLTMIEEDIAVLSSHLMPSGIQLADKISTSPTADAIPDGVAKLREYCEDRQTRLVEYVDAHRELTEALEHVEEVAREAFTYHYLHLRTWEEVCVKMGYSYEGMMRIRRRGLIQLYDFIPGEYRDVLPRAI